MRIIFAALWFLLFTFPAYAATYTVDATWTPTGDADVKVFVLCDPNAPPTTSRGSALDTVGKLTFTLTATAGQSLRCVSQGQRVSTNEWGALSAEVSVVVPLARPGAYPIQIQIKNP